MKRLIGIAVVPVLALVLAACGAENPQTDVATAGGKPTGSSNTQASKLSKQEKERKFITCMREAGIDMHEGGPPQAGKVGSGIEVSGSAGAAGGGGGVGEAKEAKPIDADPKFAKALEKCREFMPSGEDLPKPKPEEIAKMRAFTKCMREHGVDMPDPPADGGGAVLLEPGKGGAINPDSPKFRAADKACRHLAPRGAQGGVGIAGSAP